MLTPVGSSFFHPATLRRHHIVELAVVMTIREVAEVLKVGTKTVYTMAQNGEAPAFKIGGQWRFRRADIDRWIQAQVDDCSGAGRSSGGPSAPGGGADDDEGENA